MIDLRIKRMAEVLVNYSLRLKKGDLFYINGYVESMPLIKEVYREALKVGAHPYIDLIHEGMDEIFYKYADEEQLSYISPVTLEMYNKMNAYLIIFGGYNTRELSNISPNIIAKHKANTKQLKDIWSRKTEKMELNWCVCMYPTNSQAQECNMSRDELEEFIFDGCHLNNDDVISRYKEIHEEHERMISYLNNKESILVRSKDTNISLNTKGRKWLNDDGMYNFPCGEILTGPVEDSVNGVIRFSYPGIFMGREIEDIRLTFKDGIVVKAEATKGEDFLKAIIGTDEGSNKVGEFAIGTNYNIKRFIKNMLFDEKLGGTIHFALGNTYGLTGSKNSSSIHWDLLCDMKNGGEMFADGELFYKDGIFIR